jgi:hypothetical protein
MAKRWHNAQRRRLQENKAAEGRRETNTEHTIKQQHMKQIIINTIVLHHYLFYHTI